MNDYMTNKIRPRHIKMRKPVKPYILREKQATPDINRTKNTPRGDIHMLRISVSPTWIYQSKLMMKFKLKLQALPRLKGLTQ